MAGCCDTVLLRSTGDTDDDMQTANVAAGSALCVFVLLAGVIGVIVYFRSVNLMTPVALIHADGKRYTCRFFFETPFVLVYYCLQKE